MITRRAGRKGVTLIELLVTVVILGILGTAMTKLMTAQAMFYEHQGAGRTARAVSRAAVNVLLSEMRMVEVPGGIVAASPTSITLRVPYAVGLVCGPAAGGTTVALLPADSAMFAEPGFSGYAWRNNAGTYSYVEAGVAIGTAAAAACNVGGITPVTGGRLVNLAPALPGGATAGSAVIIFRRITYEFANSVELPGRVALWRRVVATGAAEELVAPFDETARFRFFALDAPNAQDAVPPLANLRGLELELVGESEGSPRATAVPRRAAVTTAVFFRNRQ
jgi:prepilin-type N-terminal cleavage/methylation domain-containing protein